MPGLNAITIIVTFMCLLNTMAALVKAFNCTQPKIYNRTAYIECSLEAADKMKDCKFYINTHNLTVIENANEMTTTRLDGLFQNNCSLQIPLLNLGPGQHQISARMTLDTATGEMVDISDSVEIELKSTLENVACDIILYETVFGHIVVCSADMVYLDINCDFTITMLHGVKYHNPGNVSYSSDILREDNTLVYKDRCMLTVHWQSYSLNMKLMNGSDIIEVKNNSFSSDKIAFDPVCKSEIFKPIYPGDTRTCKCNVSIIGKSLEQFSQEELITNLIDYVPGNPDTALSISLEDVKNHKSLFCGPVTRMGRSKIFVVYPAVYPEPPKITEFYAVNQNNKAGDGGNTDLVIRMNSYVLFSCSATGYPEPYKDLVHNDYYGEKRTFGFHGHELYMKEMTECREAGQYSCEAYNDSFNVTATKSINLYIRCPQELYDTQTNTWYGLIIGTHGRVSVPLFGYPAPTQLKLRKQNDAKMTDFKVVYTKTSMLTGIVTVIFPTVEEKHIGMYTLSVGNGIGIDFSYDFHVFKGSTNRLMSSYCVLYLAMCLWALVWKSA